MKITWGNIACTTLMVVGLCVLYAATAEPTHIAPTTVGEISDEQLNRYSLWWSILASATIFSGGAWAILVFLKTRLDRRIAARETQLTAIRNEAKAGIVESERKTGEKISGLRADFLGAIEEHRQEANRTMAAMESDIKECRADIRECATHEDVDRLWAIIEAIHRRFDDIGGPRRHAQPTVERRQKVRDE